MSARTPRVGRLLLADEVAERLRISERTLRTRSREGSLPGAMNVGTSARPVWRYDEDVLESHLRDLRDAASAASASRTT